MIPPQGLLVRSFSNASNDMALVHSRHVRCLLRSTPTRRPERPDLAMTYYIPPRNLLHSFAAPISASNSIAWDARELFRFQKDGSFCWAELREDEWIAASDRQPPSREDMLKDEAKWDQEFQYRRRIFGPSDARGETCGEILSCVRKDLAATELPCVKSQAGFRRGLQRVAQWHTT